MAVIPFLKISLAVFLHWINIESEFEQHALLALQIVQIVLEELSGLVVWTVSMDISYCLCYIYIYLFNLIYGFTVCVDVTLSIWSGRVKAAAYRNDSALGKQAVDVQQIRFWIITDGEKIINSLMF